MLVLTRKLGESIKIGNDIQVRVLDIKGKQVRLGIEAPNDLAVHREEIYAKIQRENIDAALKNNFDLDDLGKIWRKS